MNKKLLILGLLAITLVSGCTQVSDNKSSTCCVVPEREVIKIEPQEYTEFQFVCYNTSSMNFSIQYDGNVMFMDDMRIHEAEKVKFYPDIRWIMLGDNFYKDLTYNTFILCKASFGMDVKITKFYGGNEIYSKTEKIWFDVRREYNFHSFDEEIKREITNRFDIV